MWRRPFAVYYHDEYRWAARTPRSIPAGDPRGPERLARYLVHEGFVTQSQLRIPRRASYADLLRVHPHRHVESLLPRDPRQESQPERRHEHQIAEAMLRTLRLVAGATLDAARAALVEGRPMVNLSGGFVGTPPDGESGIPAVNDVAVAVAALRASGFLGRIAIVVCGSAELVGIEECLLAAGVSTSVSLARTELEGAQYGADGGFTCGLQQAAVWERELDALPSDVELVFVVGAVGKVPRGPEGQLEAWLSVARRRDALVVERLRHIRSVWLPGGRYQKGGWRAFAATLHALAGEQEVSVPASHPSWSLRFRTMAESISPEALSGSLEPSWVDVAADLGVRRLESERFLGYYTAEGIELVLQRYGVLSELQRLGYQDFTVEIGRDAQGSRVRLSGCASGTVHRLAECVAEIKPVAGRRTLYIHWLILRDPLAIRDVAESCLPGQDAPGLGIIEELSQMFAEAARRLTLDGVALVPAWYHTALMVRRLMRFLSAKRQHRFEALLDVLSGFSLAEASRRVHSGQVLLDGQPYQWEADVMVGWLDGSWPLVAEEPSTGYSPRFSLRL